VVDPCAVGGGAIDVEVEVECVVSVALWTMMGLVSADGFDRQRAISETQFQRGTVALIALRSTDWVVEVRRAALTRLPEVPIALLLEVLPLLGLLTVENHRAGALNELVDGRLGDGDAPSVPRRSAGRERRHGISVLARRRVRYPLR
jgi:hypothetical protein